MMLDTLEAHREAFPTPPVSRLLPAKPFVPRAMAVKPGAPVVVAPKIADRVALTNARLDAMRGKGPLTPDEIGRLWARAGCHAGESGPNQALRWYHSSGRVVRVRDGHSGPGMPRALYVVAEDHHSPPASGKPYPRGSAIQGAHSGEECTRGKSSRPVGGGRKK